MQAARALGLFDTKNGGIQAGAEPVPMSSAGFQSPSSAYRFQSTSLAEELKQPSSLLEPSRKRKASPMEAEAEPDEKPEAKRQNSKEEASGDAPEASNITQV